MTLTSARLERWFNSYEIPRRMLGTMEVRAAPADFEAVLRALELLEKYAPAARRRVESNVSHIVSTIAKSFHSPSIGTVYLRFRDYDSEFDLAMVILLYASSMLARRRCSALGSSDTWVARAAVRSPKRLVEWRLLREPRLTTGYKEALIEWLDEYVTVSRLPLRARLFRLIRKTARAVSGLKN